MSRSMRRREGVESLRVRLMITTMAVVVLPLIAVVVVLGWWAHDSAEQESLRVQQKAAAAVEIDVRSTIGRVETQLGVLDEVLAIGTLGRDQQKEALQNLVANDRFYHELTLLDAEGRELVRTSHFGTVTNPEHAFAHEGAALSSVLATESTYFGPVVFDDIVREPLMEVAVPLRDRRTGTIESALIATVRFKQIWDLLGGVQDSDLTDVYVVAANGTIVAHQNPAVVLRGTTIVLPPSDGQAVGLSGERAVIATQPLDIGRAEMTVVAEQTTASALKVADRAVEVIVSVAVLGLLLAITLVVLAVRQIVRPIEGLADSANKIAEGDLSHRADVESGGEIGVLARSFNAMTARLNEEIVSLEDRVRTRTEEIEQAVAVQDELIDQLEHHAANDFLTGLPNRYALESRLDVELARASRLGCHVALLLLDLDDFKDVNDSFGHPVGDQLLVAVGRRLQDTLRDADAVCRLGGDEFAIVQPDVADREQAAALAERLLAAFTAVFELDSHEVFVGVSIGVVVSEGPTPPIPQFMQRADLALYRAKGEGRNTYRFFEEDMDADIRRRMGLTQDLRGAIERGELFIEYQPQVNLADRHIVGVEALLRWQHPRLGIVMPTELVSIAEGSGLIDEIGEWVLRTACLQAVRWSADDRLPPLTVAVNVSALQIRDPGFVDRVACVLVECELEPRYLELELTETVLMETEGHVGRTLHTLHELGVGISLDDFGRGYASLDYVRRYPLSKIKIDRSFVQEMFTNTKSAAVVRSIIDLAAELDLHVIAEGVEPEQLLERLVDEGCEAVQGFYFSRPVPADAIVELVTVGTDRIHADLRIDQVSRSAAVSASEVLGLGGPPTA